MLQTLGFRPLRVLRLIVLESTLLSAIGGGLGVATGVGLLAWLGMSVAAEGVTILLVEQNARLALEVASRGYVLESGRVALSGEAARLLEHPRVRAAYLGEIE